MDAAAKALNRFEVYTKYRDFKAFHTNRRLHLRSTLLKKKGRQSGETLSKATLYATLTQLKRFFQWLAWQPGYKSHIQYSDAEYFNLSDKDTRIATAQRRAAGADFGTDQTRHPNYADEDRDRAPEPCPDRLHASNGSEG